MVVELALKEPGLREARHNCRRVIVTETVDDHNVLRPRQALKRPLNIRTLVPGQN
jgi:hypothetical protein